RAIVVTASQSPSDLLSGATGAVSNRAASVMVIPSSFPVIAGGETLGDWSYDAIRRFSLARDVVLIVRLVCRTQHGRPRLTQREETSPGKRGADDHVRTTAIHDHDSVEHR